MEGRLLVRENSGKTVFLSAYYRKLVVQGNVLIQYDFIFVICEAVIEHTYGRLKTVIAAVSAQNNRDKTHIIFFCGCRKTEARFVRKAGFTAVAI